MCIWTVCSKNCANSSQGKYFVHIGCPIHLIVAQSKYTSCSDDSGTFSIAKMKADYEAMIEKSRSAKSDGAAGVVLSRKTAAELGSVKAEAALKAVREPLGAWNW